MKRAVALVLACACAAPQAQPIAASGPAIKRLANMPDGAPAFEVLDARGVRIARIDCIWNGWYEADGMAARLLGSPALMAAVVAKGPNLTIEDLGPAAFNCVPVRSADVDSTRP